MSGPSERQVRSGAFGAGRVWLNRFYLKIHVGDNADTQISQRLCSQAAGAGDVQRNYYASYAAVNELLQAA